MLNRRPATRKTPPTMLAHPPARGDSSAEPDDYFHPSTPSSPGYRTSIGISATAAAEAAAARNKATMATAQPFLRLPSETAPSAATPPPPLRTRVVSMPVVPSEYTRRYQDMAAASTEDRSLRRVSQNIYDHRRQFSGGNGGSIRTGPSVLERAALFGGSIMSNSRVASRQSQQNPAIKEDENDGLARSTPAAAEVKSSKNESHATQTTAATGGNSTMKGTVKKWLSRGAAAVAQANATVSKRDGTTRRDPLSSLMPREHRESINLHDIDAILDMGEDAVAVEVAPAAVTSHVSAVREIWTAFETEAKSKIYPPPEHGGRTAEHIDGTNGASQASSSSVSTLSTGRDGNVEHTTASSPPIFIDLTPADATLPGDGYKLVPSSELSAFAASAVLPKGDGNVKDMPPIVPASNGNIGKPTDSARPTAASPAAWRKPPPRPSRLHIPIADAKVPAKGSVEAKTTLKSSAIHPSPVRTRSDTPPKYPTLRRVEPMTAPAPQSPATTIDSPSGASNPMASSPVDIDAGRVPKPWMANEDVQWNGRDAEGLRRNSASDIQSRPAAERNDDHVAGSDRREPSQREDGLEHYPTIHNGYESDDTVVRPPLVHSRSIHRPVQGGGLAGRQASRLTRRGSLASTLSGSDRDTLKFRTVSPSSVATQAREQMALASSPPPVSSPSAVQSWAELSRDGGPKSSPLAMVMASIVIPDLLPAGTDEASLQGAQRNGDRSPSTSNDSLGGPYGPASLAKSPAPKSKKDLHDLQSLQMLAMRPTTAAPLTPAKGGSWAMMVSRDIFERASDMERRRQEAIYELVATEEAYMADLEIVDELFFRPMQRLLGRNDIETIFGNLKAVHVATERLMHALRRRQWQGQFHVATIGDLFVERMPSLECYIAYCANHMEATARLQQLLQTDPRLHHWLQRRQSDPLCRNLDLASFLLQPMQRITRYALLLRQISSFTPVKHADHQSIRQAVDLAEDLLKRSNEAARDRADLSRLKEIAASLIMDSQEQRLDLTGSTRHLGQRRFVMEGVWVKGRQGRRITAFLFTDLLLLCEPARAQAGMYKPYLDPIPLLELEVRETSGTRSLLRLEDSAFQLVQRKRSLTVKAENASAKRKWIQTIRECTVRCQEAERTNENGWLQAPSLRELTGKVLWAIRVMIVEVTGLTTNTSAPRFDRSASSLYCSVSLNQRQTYRTAVVSTMPAAALSGGSRARWEQAFLFTITDLDDALRVALYTYDRFSRDNLRFLEFLDARGDERVALQLRQDRGIRQQQQHTADASLPVSPPGAPATSQTALSSLFASPSDTNTDRAASNQYAKAAAIAEPPPSPIVVVVSLSYRKSA